MGAEMEQEPAAVFQLLPVILITIITMAVLWPIVRRKGRSVLWLIPVLVPFVGFLVAMWIVSLTDKEVLDRLKRLEEDDVRDSMTAPAGIGSPV